MKAQKKVAEYTAWIASDGKEFFDKNKCMIYEAQIEKAKCARIVKNLPKFECESPLDDGYLSHDYYFVQDEEELNAVKHYHFNTDATANDFKPESYPLWIRCSYDDFNGYGVIERIEDYIECLEDFVYHLKTMMKENAPDRLN